MQCYRRFWYLCKRDAVHLNEIICSSKNACNLINLQNPVKSGLVEISATVNMKSTPEETHIEFKCHPHFYSKCSQYSLQPKPFLNLASKDIYLLDLICLYTILINCILQSMILPELFIIYSLWSQCETKS